MERSLVKMAWKWALKLWRSRRTTWNRDLFLRYRKLLGFCSFSDCIIECLQKTTTAVNDLTKKGREVPILNRLCDKAFESLRSEIIQAHIRIFDKREQLLRGHADEPEFVIGGKWTKLSKNGRSNMKEASPRSCFSPNKGIVLTTESSSFWLGFLKVLGDILKGPPLGLSLTNKCSTQFSSQSLPGRGPEGWARSETLLISLSH